MREAEAAQGQAGKVTTYSFLTPNSRSIPESDPLHTCPFSTQLHYYHCLFNNVLGTANVPDLWYKGKGAGAVLRMHPHLKRLPCQNHPYCAAQLSSLPALPLSSLGDETYLDIFRDFSLMASDDPEKLSRRSHDLHTL